MADDRTTVDGGPESSHVDEGLCTDILTGMAPRNTVREAVAHMRLCHACDERFRSMASDLESLRAGPLPQRSAAGEIVLVKQELPGLDARERSSGERIPDGSRWLDLARGWRSLLPRLTPALAIGTAAVAVILVIHPWRGQAPPEGLAYWIPAGSELLAQRATDGASDLAALSDGIRAYDAHDLGKAIHSLEAARTAGGAEDLRRLYLASAYGLRGDGTRALDTLAPVDLDALPDARRGEALWSRYVALVESKQSREAAALLDRLATGSGPIGDLARRRLSVTTKAASPGPR